MLKSFVVAVLFIVAIPGIQRAASADRDDEVRDFIARWNTAYTSLDATGLAALETPDYEMIDQFGHRIKSEGPDFNQRLWAMAFRDIYQGRPGPARQIESIRFLTPQVAIVQARANHPGGVTLDGGTHSPPFWEINTYTLMRSNAGWKVAVLDIHNQIDPASERAGEQVPNVSLAKR
jgi:uncharacterized protein (TIGR02246 family)